MMRASGVEVFCCSWVSLARPRKSSQELAAGGDFLVEFAQFYLRRIGAHDLVLGPIELGREFALAVGRDLVFALGGDRDAL